ncbi:MAG: YlxM family DNA-binding protein [Firmicutes bacterium]|jgi:predicted DNA-binding protein YlxM (UPF0122 family)|nr:YlxM family DNA-binding protein [Bacillota bacterium]
MVRMGVLLDWYAPLLTARQREICALHFAEDYSLAEIAELFGVTRQAVHDTIARAERSLERCERTFGWASLADSMVQGLAEVDVALAAVAHSDPEARQKAGRARAIVARLTEAVQRKGASPSV